MPEISRFLGIVIGMFYREHGVAHFHAVYGEHEITVEIETGRIHGSFPPRALRLVLEWSAISQWRAAGELGARLAGASRSTGFFLWSRTSWTITSSRHAM